MTHSDMQVRLSARAAQSTAQKSTSLFETVVCSKVNAFGRDYV
jgi:hypothetical protein